MKLELIWDLIQRDPWFKEFKNKIQINETSLQANVVDLWSTLSDKDKKNYIRCIAEADVAQKLVSSNDSKRNSEDEQEDAAVVYEDSR